MGIKLIKVYHGYNNSRLRAKLKIDDRIFTIGHSKIKTSLISGNDYSLECIGLDHDEQLGSQKHKIMVE